MLILITRLSLSQWSFWLKGHTRPSEICIFAGFKCHYGIFWWVLVCLTPLSETIFFHLSQSEICIYAGMQVPPWQAAPLFSPPICIKQCIAVHLVSPNGSFICSTSTVSKGSKEIQFIHLSNRAVHLRLRPKT